VASTVVHAGGSGAGWLWMAQAGSDAWRRSPQPLPAGSLVDGVAFDDDGTTYVTAATDPLYRRDSEAATVIVTHNSARSWTSHSTPCVAEPAWAGPVSSAETGDDWLLCRFEARLGQEAKELYRS